MPYIIAEAWWPTDLTQEVADKYMEMLKNFPFDRSLGKETIPIASTTDKKGAKVLSVMEVKQGKLEEALTWVGRRILPFQSIKGYEFKIRVWNTVVESLEPLGLSLPG